MNTKLYIFSGAGLSADSGIPTFRDANGLWENYPVDKIANYDTWQENRELVFKFYNERRVKLAEVQPNLAHITCAQLEKELGSARVTHFTQNIDNLLERAGCKNVTHVHGVGTELKCVSCQHVWDIGHTEADPNMLCKYCKKQHTVKPGVVFFKESAPHYMEMISTFHKPTKHDVLVVIGTSGNVVPMKWIIGQPKINKPYTILINTELGALNLADFNVWLKGSASEVLPQAKELILEKLS